MRGCFVCEVYADHLDLDVLAHACPTRCSSALQATMTRAGPVCGAQDGEWTAADRAGLKTPRQLHHLNIAAAAPYDHAAFVERCVGVEGRRAHSLRT